MDHNRNSNNASFVAFTPMRTQSVLKSYLTLAQALEFSEEARVICESKYPYKILYCNKEWTRITAWEQHEIEGRTLSVLHGALTDKDVVSEMMHNVIFSGSGAAKMIYYTKKGDPLFVTIFIQPLTSLDVYGQIRVSHLMARLESSDQLSVLEALANQSAGQSANDEGFIRAPGNVDNAEKVNMTWSFVHSVVQKKRRGKSRADGSSGSSGGNSSIDDSSDDGNTSGGSTGESNVSDSRSSGGSTGGSSGGSNLSSGSSNNHTSSEGGTTTGSDDKSSAMSNDSSSDLSKKNMLSNSGSVSSSSISSSSTSEENLRSTNVGGNFWTQKRATEYQANGSFENTSSYNKRERDRGDEGRDARDGKKEKKDSQRSSH